MFQVAENETLRPPSITSVQALQNPDKHSEIVIDLSWDPPVSYTDNPVAGYYVLITDDFTIQTWDGKRWIDQVTQKDYTPQKSGPHEFAFAPTTTDRIRVVGTKLRFVRGEYVFQLAEIEVP